jgi:outer membrane protein assembly factor BamD
VLEAYQEGKDYLENGDPLYAAKKFNEAEILFHNQNGLLNLL